MKILVLTPQLPYPPLQGTSLRNFHLLRELASRHDLSLLSFLQGGDELRPDSPLHAICHEIRMIPAPPRRPLAERALTSLISPLPDMALRLPSAQMLDALCAWTRPARFDVIQVEGIEMAAYGLVGSHAPQHPERSGGALPPRSRRTRTVFDDHNAEYVLQRSAFRADLKQPARWHGALYSFVQWQKLVRYERRVLQAHDAVAAVSESDAAALLRLAPDKEIHVVPNGVDTQTYAPSAAGDCATAATVDLVFTGKMDYRPNVDAALWFADEILPRVRAQVPNARFVVVGQNPHSRLRPLARRAAVWLTGQVDDIRPYVAGACVYVAPLRMGGGTRLKVLQAMAMAKPIVSTTLGCNGIQAQDGREALLADSPQNFAAAVVRLTRDEALRRELGAHARALAVARYDWSHIAPLMEALYQ